MADPLATPPQAPLDVEISRQEELGVIFEKLEALCPDVKMFTAANLASVYKQTAERLQEAVAASSPPEVCVCAAIQLDNGVILRGHRHDDCFQTALNYGYKGRISQAMQGFVTSRNRFVGREEGARLQREAGVVSAWTGKLPALLFSEDLYFNDTAADTALHRLPQEPTHDDREPEK